MDLMESSYIALALEGVKSLDGIRYVYPLDNNRSFIALVSLRPAGRVF